MSIKLASKLEPPARYYQNGGQRYQDIRFEEQAQKSLAGYASHMYPFWLKYWMRAHCSATGVTIVYWYKIFFVGSNGHLFLLIVTDFQLLEASYLVVM